MRDEHAQDSAAHSKAHSPLGRLVDIGGRKLHLCANGAGGPTVVLVAGGGAFSIDWMLVQERVAPSTRVCSYDRAGLGWSDAGPAEETVEETVDDLHLLLHAAAETGPYVLVGTSIGGLYIRAYQRAFPDEVAALVFVNSTHHVGLSVAGKVGLLWQLTEDEIRSAYPLPSSAKGAPPSRVHEPFDRLPPTAQVTRGWLAQRLWERWQPSQQGPEAMLSWRAEFSRQIDQTCSGPPYPLGDLPIVVVSSTESAGVLAQRQQLDREFRDRTDAADGLESLSSNGLYVIAADSGHEIHLYQPDLVADVVRRVVAAVRTGTPLRGRD